LTKLNGHLLREGFLEGFEAVKGFFKEEEKKFAG